MFGHKFGSAGERQPNREHSFRPQLECLEDRVLLDANPTATPLLGYVNTAAGYLSNLSTALQSGYSFWGQYVGSQISNLASSGLAVAPNQLLLNLNLELSGQAGGGQALSALENAVPNLENAYAAAAQNSSIFGNLSTGLSAFQTLYSAYNNDLGGTVENGIGTLISGAAPLIYGGGVGGLLSLEYSAGTAFANYFGSTPTGNAFYNSLADATLSIPGVESGINYLNNGFGNLVGGIGNYFGGGGDNGGADADSSSGIGFDSGYTSGGGIYSGGGALTMPY